MDKTPTIIGRAEEITLLTHGITDVPARVDTGAKTSSLWASNIVEDGDALTYQIFGEGSPLYTGETVKTTHFTRLLVANSTGHVHERYAVELTIKLADKTITALFTLTDRSMQVYPVLIGRNVLAGNFLVDASRGKLPRHGTAHAKHKFTIHQTNGDVL